MRALSFRHFCSLRARAARLRLRATPAGVARTEVRLDGPNAVSRGVSRRRWETDERPDASARARRARRFRRTRDRRG